MRKMFHFVECQKFDCETKIGYIHFHRFPTQNPNYSHDFWARALVYLVLWVDTFFHLVFSTLAHLHHSISKFKCKTVRTCFSVIRIQMKLGSHMDSGVCHLHIILLCSMTRLCFDAIVCLTNKLQLMHAN